MLPGQSPYVGKWLTELNWKVWRQPKEKEVKVEKQMGDSVTLTCNYLPDI